MTIIRRKAAAGPFVGEQSFFATTAKGVEEVLAREMTSLGLGGVTMDKGGVRFTGDLSACYRANLWLRTASRILITLTEFPCHSPQDLYDGVRALPWDRYLTPDTTLAVECVLRDSALTHSGFVALKTKDAIVDTLRDRFGRRPSVNPKDPDLLVNVHLVRNRCTISLDSSGTGLDRRGYRAEAGEAPLRETLAAALVLLTDWDGTVPLVDPLCGSGTILIEAVLKALNRAPGLVRERFGFQRWPAFDVPRWRRLLEEARQTERTTLAVPILGSDRLEDVLAVARGNSRRAGVEKFISFEARDLRDLVPPPAPGVILTNPPYGRRLGDEEQLKSFYRQIGDVFKQRCAGYTAWLFTGNLDLAKEVGLKASRRIALFNGPLDCRLLKYDLY
ncbi:rRNA (guanine-N(2)-)-methyltransferase [Geobacter metallireducens RCH3]|uniref:23S rRNA (2-N-methyl-G2445)-methyltransferase, putative n=1 Tax=Geobacter metallireducens (strain ATCC 53774 / DSM 7210 / GS-15) TaxID=269799 RepID=Q39YN3_GEOMG|nr:THUMP domain-containing protein [Geobacter metallireducens]ABB30641.1 23S rRNA (2-N-methyl-G2445)-methyltransferase, putative [Geobacter metallireducens GS-15]EHP88028.1 rRNA (guanine-N(2)-)-methyltransferase [Geobacter metallireducens RCH3]